MLTPRARPVLRAYAGVGAPLYARALGADAELLAAAPGTLTHLMQLADTHSSTNFLAAPARTRLTHLALPHFVGVPPAAHDVPPAAVPHIAGSTLYDGLHPAALFGAVGGSLKELVLLVPCPTWTRACEYEHGAGVVSRDEVSLQALYKQVGSLLPNVQALRTLRVRVSLPTEAAKADEGPSRLALWKRPPLGFSKVFPIARFSPLLFKKSYGIIKFTEKSFSE
ncbi:hypothetical protein EDB86DRAFT_3094430 [Lactarius hatsudake]|nr:hypothetical protein EDB86DRAFT_3094430 [Lactarius hatsudake]